MIYSVTSSSPHLYATGGMSLPYVSSDLSNPVQGMVRVNGSNMEVFNCSGWMTIQQDIASVGLTGEAESAISWAIERMKQEQHWAELAEKNAAVKIALGHFEQARQQLAVTAQLAREYDTETTN